MAQNTPAPAAGQKPKKVKKSATSGMSRALVRRETTSAYLFLLPSLIFFVTFVVVPMFICVYLQLYRLRTGRRQGASPACPTTSSCLRTPSSTTVS